MQRRTYRLLIGSTVALLIVLILVAWRLGGGLPRETVRLPNGEVLRLQEVTFGATHQWSPQPWWQRLLGPLTPQSKAAQPYQTRFYVSGTPQPHLVFWFTGAKTTQPSSHGQRPVFAADDAGREYAQVDNLWELRRGTPRVEYFRVPLPRASRTVRLRFYAASGPEFSEITVPNPAYGAAPVNPSPTVQGSADLVPPPPTPQAAGCPAAARAGEVSVTLTELTTGLSAGGRNRSRPEVLLASRPTPNGPGELPWTRARLRFDRGGGEWAPLVMTLRDADGNVAQQSYQTPRKDEVWTALPGWIGLDGGPLSARILVQRRAGAGYPPEQSWTIPNVAVPGEGAETGLALSRTILGVRLGLHALAARGTTTGPGRRDLEKSPYLRLRATGLVGDRLLSVWAVDQRGRRYDAGLKDYGVAGVDYDFRIRMPIARDAKRVTLHLAVHPGRETRTLDFVAQPSQVSTDAQPN